MDNNCLTISPLATGTEENPAFTEASLRWLIYRVGENGIDEVLVRAGRRVLFDMDRFENARRRAAK
jgi:hypothetical protein